MKRIVKLKGQMIILVILSIAVGWILCMMLSNIRKQPTYDESLNFAHSSGREFVKEINDLKLESYKDNYIEEALKDFLHTKAKSWQKPQIYLTDDKGNVIYCNHKSAVNKINISGKNEIIEINDRNYTVTNIIKINDSRYIAAAISGYVGSDFDVIIAWVVISMIVFFVLTYGMVNYLNKISDYVRKIAHGDLKTRVPVKYKNEISLLAKNINYMAQQLDEHDAKQKEFITNISHDLRTPLTTMIGYLDMIEENKYDDEEELKHYIDIISRKASYLKSMMEDFFYYSKLSSDDIPLEITKINLNQCLEMIVDEEEQTFSDKGLKLIKQICPEDVFIDGDPMLIARAVQNLLSNASKYSRKGTDVIAALSRDYQQKSCIISVKNIPVEQLDDNDIEKLFNRLYKKDKSRKSNGSGLGLAITREIIKNHQGNICAHMSGEYLEMQIKIGLSKI